MKISYTVKPVFSAKPVPCKPVVRLGWCKTLQSRAATHKFMESLHKVLSLGFVSSVSDSGAY